MGECYTSANEVTSGKLTEGEVLKRLQKVNEQIRALESDVNIGPSVEQIDQDGTVVIDLHGGLSSKQNFELSYAVKLSMWIHNLVILVNRKIEEAELN